ncbi:hypothetical protein D3C80_1978850 [compost metagenome]
MCNQELQFFCDAGGVRRNQCAVRTVGMEGHQGPVEPGFIMGPCDRFHILGLQGRAAARVNFRRMVTAYVADEFNGHGEFLFIE